MECPEDADPDVIASIPESDVVEIIGEVVVGDEARAPSRFERAQLFHFFRKLRAPTQVPATEWPAADHRANARHE